MTPRREYHESITYGQDKCIDGGNITVRFFKGRSVLDVGRPSGRPALQCRRRADAAIRRTSASFFLVVGVEQACGTPAGEHDVGLFDDEETRRVAVVAFGSAAFRSRCAHGGYGRSSPATRRWSAARSSYAPHRHRRGSSPCRHRAPAAEVRSAPWRWRGGGRSAPLIAESDWARRALRWSPRRRRRSRRSRA